MSNQRLPKVKLGCCGFPGGRKGYFSQFHLVEVQQTFYKMPRLETAGGGGRRLRLILNLP
jgi:hypothetical protein